MKVARIILSILSILSIFTHSITERSAKPEKPGPAKPAKDYAPLKILVRFIENNGDPSAYLETMSVSYPDHPFCQTLITCGSADQLLEKLTSLKPRLPALFADTGKAWLEELFEIIRKFESEHEPGIETEDRADHQAASQRDAAALSEH